MQIPAEPRREILRPIQLPETSQRDAADAFRPTKLDGGSAPRLLIPTGDAPAVHLPGGPLPPGQPERHPQEPPAGRSGRPLRRRQVRGTIPPQPARLRLHRGQRLRRPGPAADGAEDPEVRRLGPGPAARHALPEVLQQDRGGQAEGVRDGQVPARAGAAAVRALPREAVAARGGRAVAVPGHPGGSGQSELGVERAVGRAVGVPVRGFPASGDRAGAGPDQGGGHAVPGGQDEVRGGEVLEDQPASEAAVHDGEGVGVEEYEGGVGWPGRFYYCIVLAGYCLFIVVQIYLRVVSEEQLFVFKSCVHCKQV